jgi:hypothetical protein
VYDFTWSRNRDGQLKMLTGYRGYLQVDAAPAYNYVFAEWDHRSRMHGARPACFKEALPTAAVPCAGIRRSSSSCMGSGGRLTTYLPARDGRRRYRRARSVQPSASRCATCPPDTLHRGRPTQNRQPRGRAGATADHAWAQKLAVRGERSSGAPNRCPVFADRPASTCSSIRSCICAISLSASRRIRHASS